MKAFSDTIKIEQDKCPPECLVCKDKCFDRFEDAGCGGIKVIHLPEENVHTAVVCNQCGEPVCEECCPTGSIVKDADSGIVRIDRAKCLGCGL